MQPDLKKILYISTVLFVLSCENIIPEIRCYPSNPFSEKDSIQVLDLNISYMNFKEITHWISKNQHIGRTPVIKFNDGELLKYIYPLVPSNGLIKERNILSLKSDSILIDDGYPISELKWVLKRHYTNNGKELRYPSSSERAGVRITLDTNKTTKDLEQSLILLTTVFDEVNREVKDTLQLKFLFDYLRQIPPPPPPPNPLP